MEDRSRSLEVLIPSGTALSDPIDMRGLSRMAIHMPAAWDPASIAFVAAQYVDGTYTPVNDYSDTLIEIATPAVDTTYQSPLLDGVRFVRLWSETAGVDVNQTGDRTLPIDLIDATREAAAVASDLSNHVADSGAGVHGATAIGASVLAAADAAAARTAVLAAPLRPAQVNVAGTTKVFALTDEGAVVSSQSGSATEFTIPLNATVAFPVNTIINVEQHGSGALTITAVAGVTLNGVDGGSEVIAAQWGAAAIRKIAADDWVITGSI